MPHPNRRGLVLIIVMVCLALFVILGGVLTKLILTERRQARVEEWRVQAEWLAESAIERAAARLEQTPDYAGESWQPPAGRLGERNGGIVAIQIERDATRENRRLVRVVADFMRDGERCARRTREITIELKTKKT